MDVVWSEFARAGLAKYVSAHARRSVEHWIYTKLRTDPWLVGYPIPVSRTARVGGVVAGASIRFLFDYDEKTVRVLSISRESVIAP